MTDNKDNIRGESVTTLRQDAWQEQDDLVLAQTVLEHIREGSTQLAAFEEAAGKLNRTAAACGFRWNSEVRKQYDNEIKKAKSERVSKKVNRKQIDSFATVSSATIEDPQINADYLDQIISAANNQKVQMANMAKQIKSLTEELQQVRNELEQYKQGSSKPDVVNDDFKALIQILDRARSLGALGEQSAI